MSDERHISGVYPTGQHPSSPGEPAARARSRDTRDLKIDRLELRVQRLEEASAGHGDDGKQITKALAALDTKVAVMGSQLDQIVAKLGGAGANSRDVARTVVSIVGGLVSIAALVLSIALALR